MPRKLKRILRFMGRLTLTGTILGAALLTYGIWESRHPVVVTYHVEVPNLPRALDGYRIVQLSDLHRSALVPDDLIGRAVDLANSTDADAAVLTGDFVSWNASNAQPCVDMLTRLRTWQGSFAVLGNHDHWTDEKAVARALKSRHVRVLDNTSARLSGGLYLAGIDDKWSGEPDVRAAFKNVPHGTCCVMLSHTPLSIGLLRGKRGLLITGHTHGGQVLLPLVPRNKLPGLLGWRYIKGWYRQGDILMYVNRGIGTVGPCIRLRCPPEVTLYVLHPGRHARVRVDTR